MTDTTEEIKQMVREQIMARSPAERFVIGAEMFDSAMAVVKASLPANISRDEYKRQLFKRLYGLELPDLAGGVRRERATLMRRR
jgi:hypothetical protein